MNGSEDDDAVYGGAGNDVLLSGYGLDTLYGGTGNDRLSVDFENQVAYGGDGTGDLLKLFWHDPAGSLAPVVLSSDIATVADLSIAITGIERFDITTSYGDDTIETGDGADLIAVLHGANVVDAAGGDDSVFYRHLPERRGRASLGHPHPVTPCKHVHHLR